MSYPPPIYAVDDPEELRALLRATGLGTLISPSAEGVTTTHMPFFYDETANTLRGHLARNNPHSQLPPGPALALFHRMDAYVTPNWYPSKARHGRAAPTWNYEFLHVTGPLRWIEDPDWLLANVSEISDRYEAGQPSPWKVADAPTDYIDKLIPHIIGLEIAIERIECRRKLSQGSKAEDRDGVIAGLSERDAPGDGPVVEAMKALSGRIHPDGSA